MEEYTQSKKHFWTNRLIKAVGKVTIYTLGVCSFITLEARVLASKDLAEEEAKDEQSSASIGNNPEVRALNAPLPLNSSDERDILALGSERFTLGTLEGVNICCRIEEFTKKDWRDLDALRVKDFNYSDLMTAINRHE